jgi:hypothetical protein
MRIVIAIAVLAAGCRSSDETPPPVEPSGFTLVSTGAAPLRPLRYHLAKGAANKLELAMDLDLVAGGRGGKLPTLVIDLDVAITEVTEGGDAKLSTTVTGARAAERAGSVVPVAAIAPMAKSLEGIRYTATLSPDGQLRDLAVAAVPAGLDQQVEQLTQGLEQVAIRLPPVPVGVGAKWSTRKETTRNGLAMTTVTTIEITAIDGERITFASTSTVAAPDQTVTVSGVKASFKDVGGGGSGSGTVDLATMAMRGELTAELRGTMSTAGQTSPMQMAMKMTVR